MCKSEKCDKLNVVYQQQKGTGNNNLNREQRTFIRRQTNWRRRQKPVATKGSRQKKKAMEGVPKPVH